MSKYSTFDQSSEGQLDHTSLINAILAVLSDNKWVKGPIIFRRVIKRYPDAVYGGVYKYLHWALQELVDDEIIIEKKTSKPREKPTWSYHINV